MKQMEQKQRSLAREQMQAIVREEIKRSRIAKPIVPKERKKRSKQPLISDMIAQEDILKNEANLTQLNMQEATTSTQVSDESAETQLALPPQQPKTPTKEPNAEAQKKSVEKKRKKLRESSINLPREPKKKAIVTPSEKIGDETNLPKKRGRKRKSEISTTDAATPKAKIARKEKLEAISKENTAQEKTPKEKTPNGKIAKEKTLKLSQKKLKKISEKFVFRKFSYLLLNDFAFKISINLEMRMFHPQALMEHSKLHPYQYLQMRLMVIRF